MPTKLRLSCRDLLIIVLVRPNLSWTPGFPAAKPDPEYLHIPAAGTKPFVVMDEPKEPVCPAAVMDQLQLHGCDVVDRISSTSPPTTPINPMKFYYKYSNTGLHARR